MTDSRTPNNDEVICPNCTHQFRAIPVNVQARIAELEVKKRAFDGWVRFNGITVLRNDYLPTKTMVVSPDLYDHLSGELPEEPKHEVKPKEEQR